MEELSYQQFSRIKIRERTDDYLKFELCDTDSIKRLRLVPTVAVSEKEENIQFPNLCCAIFEMFYVGLVKVDPIRYFDLKLP